MQGLIAEHGELKASGDEKQMKELEDKLNAKQNLIHKQGFSTWPVDNILETIDGEIQEIAKQAEVDLIISKWDIAYQRSGINFIDVTLDLVHILLHLLSLYRDS